MSKKTKKGSVEPKPCAKPQGKLRPVGKVIKQPTGKAGKVNVGGR